jgi:hypothetical protein
VSVIPGFHMCLRWSAQANSTCFSDKLMESLAMKADSMKAGAYFITTTRRLPSEYFELLDTVRDARLLYAAPSHLVRMKGRAIVCDTESFDVHKKAGAYSTTHHVPTPVRVLRAPRHGATRD